MGLMFSNTEATLAMAPTTSDMVLEPSRDPNEGAASTNAFGVERTSPAGEVLQNSWLVFS